MRWRVVFVLLLLTALGLPLSGDQRLGWIEGTLTTAESGAPLRLAIVAVQGSHRRVRSDAEGRYNIVAEPGNYTIVVSYPGRQTGQRQVTVYDGHGTAADFALATQ